jgi:hypothetical protein
MLSITSFLSLVHNYFYILNATLMYHSKQSIVFVAYTRIEVSKRQTLQHLTNGKILIQADKYIFLIKLIM